MDFKDLVLNMLSLFGPTNQRILARKLDCGTHALETALKELCKEGKVFHQGLATPKGYKPDHLFWVVK